MAAKLKAATAYEEISLLTAGEVRYETENEYESEDEGNYVEESSDYSELEPSQAAQVVPVTQSKNPIPVGATPQTPGAV